MLKAFFDMHVQPSSGVRGVKLCMSLQSRTYFVCTSGEGSGESACLRRLACAFASRLSYKNPNSMNWLQLGPTRKNNKKLCKGADQTAHARSLISTFVINVTLSIIHQLTTCKF